jgi:hypothetical protein
MKCGLLSILELIAMAVVAFTANPASAQTVAAGPYYAHPSWDQTLACVNDFFSFLVCRFDSLRLIRHACGVCAAADRLRSIDPQAGENKKYSYDCDF